MTGLQSPPRGVRPSDREQAELIRGLYDNTPVGVAGALFGVAVLCWVLLYIAPERAPWVWGYIAVTGASAAWQLFLWGRYRRARPAEAAWPRWARWFVIASFVEGVRWGLGTLFLPAPFAIEQQLWVTMVIACAAASSVSSLGSYVPAFYALLIPAGLPIAALGMIYGLPRYWAMSLLSAVLVLTIGWLGWRQSHTLAEALRLRFENMDLVEDLKRQKERAEQANVAKSRFLAAASHDLRQPIHALGLFVGALRRERMSPAARRLTDQVGENIDAMTGLFDGLLDLSQLDAGVVRPHEEVFALEPLLDRICREEAADLQGKPVVLRRVATSAAVRTDPVLLQRMIRNLVSNAIRHTAEGRVLVGCRRRGEVVVIEVRDTGPGIAPEDQEKVFEEYVQLTNPERDRTRGLGLGLAITRRLANLLGCPLDLVSVVGRGSTFRVAIPAARLESVPPGSADAPQVAPRGLVFVVDDEPAVLQGTAELLGAWGYEPVVAGSGDELIARVDPRRPPDLVICDWRLRGDETAVEVIDRVRALFGRDVPALLITGDTAPSRLQDADRTGFALLHKPVAPGRLRAMVGNLIRQAQEKMAGPPAGSGR